MNAGEEPRCAVVQAVPTTEFVVAVPDERQEQKAERECGKAAYRGHQIMERFRHVERDHKQRERKTENRVAERFQPRHLASAQTKSGKITKFTRLRHVRLCPEQILLSTP